jgi:hypothetical protein
MLILMAFNNTCRIEQQLSQTPNIYMLLTSLCLLASSSLSANRKTETVVEVLIVRTVPE